MTPAFEQHKGGFTVSTDPARLNHDLVHQFLASTYWGKQRPRAILEKAMRNSLCFGVYRKHEQVGFARVITDYATYAYLADVFILEEHRGKGLGKWLVQSVIKCPDLVPMRRWALITRDAQKLYRECGFAPLNEPEHHMQLLQPYPGEKPKSLKSALSRFAKGFLSKGPGRTH